MRKLIYGSIFLALVGIGAFGFVGCEKTEYIEEIESNNESQVIQQKKGPWWIMFFPPIKIKFGQNTETSKCVGSGLCEISIGANPEEDDNINDRGVYISLSYNGDVYLISRNNSIEEFKNGFQLNYETRIDKESIDFIQKKQLKINSNAKLFKGVKPKYYSVNYIDGFYSIKLN